MMATVSDAFVYPVTSLVVIFGSDFQSQRRATYPTLGGTSTPPTPSEPVNTTNIQDDE